jgi:hypothetical protein
MKKKAARRTKSSLPPLEQRCCGSVTDTHFRDCPTRLAKEAFDAHRDRNEAAGIEVCMVVVGYVSGREPFRLLGRVSADTGMEALPDPPLTMTEMQPVAFAAKMALAKVLTARRKPRRG